MSTYTLIPVLVFFYEELEWQSKISRTVMTRFVTTLTPRTDNFGKYT